MRSSEPASDEDLSPVLRRPTSGGDLIVPFSEPAGAAFVAAKPQVPVAAAWSRWAVASPPWTVGVEEEVMLLVPPQCSLAYRADAVIRG
jgi:hypothetical protein